MTIFIGSSWKMTKRVASARAFVESLNEHGPWPEGVQPFLLPPATLLTTVRDALDPATGVWIGAQNAHWMPPGAFTGEVSMAQVHDAGARIVEIGHSERREFFSETDETIARKVRAALDTGMTPLLCVGESLAVREGGDAERFVTAQVDMALTYVPDAEHAAVFVAYEPIWSIGETGVPADPAEVAETVHAIHGRNVGVVLYGGSVTTSNARDLLAFEDIDGLFVGRAAWEPRGFIELIELGAEAARERLERSTRGSASQ